MKIWKNKNKAQTIHIKDNTTAFKDGYLLKSEDWQRTLKV